MNELKQWAESRETDIRVAGAIRHLAFGNTDQMQTIWEHPTPIDIMTIWNHVTGNGAMSDNVEWGESSLRTIFNQILSNISDKEHI